MNYQQFISTQIYTLCLPYPPPFAIIIRYTLIISPYAFTAVAFRIKLVGRSQCLNFTSPDKTLLASTRAGARLKKSVFNALHE